MPAVKKVTKTYGKRNIAEKSKVLDKKKTVKNPKKKRRRKTPIEIKELPNSTPILNNLTPDSVNVSLYNTFDKLLLQESFNKVNKTRHLYKYKSTEESTEISNCLLVSPPNTRSTYKKRQQNLKTYRKQNKVKINVISNSDLDDEDVASTSNSLRGAKLIDTLDRPVEESLWIIKDKKECTFSSVNYMNYESFKKRPIGFASTPQVGCYLQPSSIKVTTIRNENIEEKEKNQRFTPVTTRSILSVDDQFQTVTPLRKKSTNKNLRRLLVNLSKNNLLEQSKDLFEYSTEASKFVLNEKKEIQVDKEKVFKDVSTDLRSISDVILCNSSINQPEDPGVSPSLFTENKRLSQKIDEGVPSIIELSSNVEDDEPSVSEFKLEIDIPEQNKEDSIREINNKVDIPEENKEESIREIINKTDIPEENKEETIREIIINSPKNLSDIVEVDSDIIETSQTDNVEQFVKRLDLPKVTEEKIKKPFPCKPGKLYRRSLNLARRNTIVCKFFPESSELSYVLSTNKENINPNLETSLRNLSLKQVNRVVPFDEVVTAKEVVLRRCGQTEPLSFQKCYSSKILKNCQKIGEGVFGEVYLYRNQDGGTTVMKIIPIEGDQIVNGEKQKKFGDILSEILIAMELSNLRQNHSNKTYCFNEVKQVKCVKGQYPSELLDLWDLYDEIRGSENDSPDMFNENQLYIILELTNGGNDMESFVFNNSLQALSIFQQIALALAIAEKQLKFEHRDLHWGNILITNVEKDKKIQFCYDDNDIEIPSYGVQACIIDFTLSRIEFDGVVIFNDLKSDKDLFSAEGDHQFEIYRLMQRSNGNDWEKFQPFTNILWLEYVLHKMITALRYKNIKSKVHKINLDKLTKIHKKILTFRSVSSFIEEEFL